MLGIFLSELSMSHLEADGVDIFGEDLFAKSSNKSASTSHL
jgi:hypothetical protein